MSDPAFETRQKGAWTTGKHPPFVGRGCEVSALGQLVAAHQLVFLLGPPLTGKSRIAEEVARRKDYEVLWLEGKDFKGVETLATRLAALDRPHSLKLRWRLRKLQREMASLDALHPSDALQKILEHVERAARKTIDKQERKASRAKFLLVINGAERLEAFGCLGAANAVDMRTELLRTLFQRLVSWVESGLMSVVLETHYSFFPAFLVKSGVDLDSKRIVLAHVFDFNKEDALMYWRTLGVKPQVGLDAAFDLFGGKALAVDDEYVEKRDHGVENVLFHHVDYYQFDVNSAHRIYVAMEQAPVVLLKDLVANSAFTSSTDAKRRAARWGELYVDHDVKKVEELLKWGLIHVICTSPVPSDDDFVVMGSLAYERGVPKIVKRVKEDIVKHELPPLPGIVPA